MSPEVAEKVIYIHLLYACRVFRVQGAGCRVQSTSIPMGMEWSAIARPCLYRSIVAL